jgi:hypothetical protein
MTTVNNEYRGGTLRFTNSAGEVHIAEPGSQWYSTLTMVAQEVWSEEHKEFRPIFDDEADDE